MKRDPALQSLSRDHLKALMAAKALCEARDPEAAATAFGVFWGAEHAHFRLEEEILLPRWAAAAEPDAEAVRRVLDDHLHIRSRALRLADGALTLAELHDLGQRLHDHVRFEERTLFPLIERTLTPEALERLGQALAAAEAQAGDELSALGGS